MMSQVRYSVDEVMCYKDRGMSNEDIAYCILNACSIAETDTIQDYLYAKMCLIKLYENEPDKAKVIGNMFDVIIKDEADHDSSFKKAAAIINGSEEPKPKEYNEAKNDG